MAIATILDQMFDVDTVNGMHPEQIKWMSKGPAIDSVCGTFRK